MKNALIALSLTLATVLAVGTPPPSHASDGLAGKELKPVSEAKRQVLGGVAEFLGRRFFGEEEEEAAPLDSRETLDEFTRFLGGRLAEERAATGRIAKVLVLDEEDARLRLRVEHFDLDGCILRVRALDGDRRGQSAIVAQDVALAAGERETEIEIELALGSETDDGSAVTSSFLAVVAYDCAGDDDASRVFELGKTWSLPVATADRVIAVTPRPIGAAAQLGASDTTLSLPPVVTQKRYATAVYVTPAARVSTGATAAPRHPGATVRDHRTGGTSGGARSPGVTVRDHRSGGTSGGSRSPGVTVRDHRSGGTSGGSRSPGVTVRDHRTGSTGGRTSDRYQVPARATGSFGQVVLGVDPEDEQRGALGPANMPIDLLDGLRVEPGVDLDYAEILDTFPVVFRDRTEASGVFYFLPGRYSLAWDPFGGYGVDFLYNAAADGASDGAVTVNLQLDSGVDVAEVQFARRLLEAQHKRGAIGRQPLLRRLPLTAAPEVRLAASLAQQYDIPPENVIPSSASDTLGELTVAITTDRVTKENLQLALTDGLGLNGIATFTTVSEELPALDVEIEARLSAAKTFGRLAWQREQEWRNEIPYPIRLRYLHALLLEKNEPVVYSWDLEGTDVPSQARVRLDAGAIPSWLEDRALRTWIDYAVDHTCEPCKQTAVESITGGVATLASDEISFRALEPLADSGALEIALSVRSRYFHPQRREFVSKPVLVMGEDGQVYPVGPIYTASYESEASGEPLFEYQLQLVMPDGTTHASNRWIDGRALYVPIGSVQIERALGFVPGPAGGN